MEALIEAWKHGSFYAKAELCRFVKSHRLLISALPGYGMCDVRCLIRHIARVPILSKVDCCMMCRPAPTPLNQKGACSFAHEAPDHHVHLNGRPRRPCLSRNSATGACRQVASHTASLMAPPLPVLRQSSSEPLILCGRHMRAPSMMLTQAEDMPVALPDPCHCRKNVSEAVNVLQLKPAILGRILVPLLLYLLAPLHQFFVVRDLQANGLLQRA